MSGVAGIVGSLLGSITQSQGTKKAGELSSQGLLQATGAQRSLHKKGMKLTEPFRTAALDGGLDELKTKPLHA